MKTILSTFLFALSLFAQEHCNSNKVDYNLCFTELELIRPTQANVGLFAIKEKAGKIEKEWAQGELTEHLVDEVNPAIISPDGFFYIIDGHHHNFALDSANIPNSEKKSYLKIIADFRGSPQSLFEDFMIQNKYTFLKDRYFKKISFSKLPSSISKLTDNPYRSLAWIARNRGCYKKSKVPFAEFLWGEFFYRNDIKLTTSLDAQQMAKALEKAMSICNSPMANNLPGYKH